MKARSEYLVQSRDMAFNRVFKNTLSVEKTPINFTSGNWQETQMPVSVSVLLRESRLCCLPISIISRLDVRIAGEG